MKHDSGTFSYYGSLAHENTLSNEDTFSGIFSVWDKTDSPI